MEPWHLSNCEHLARERLEPGVFDYYAGTAGNGFTHRENLAAFERIKVLPRVLRGVESADLRTTVLGARVSMPIIVAPMALQGLACAEGDAATARAAGRLGTLMVAATEGSRSLEEVAAVASGPLWFQLYMYRGMRDLAEELVCRARDAGYRAIVLTADAPRWRRSESPEAPLVIPPGVENANFPQVDPDSVQPAALHWDDVTWLRSLTDLPLVIKGVLAADDARLAAEHGAAGVIVSNHGGRELDGAPASIEVLPGVVDAMAGRSEVYLDGGIRRGTDVLKALALGARAVLVGRPVLWGLAVGGAAGAERALALLRDDLEHAMVLAGCPDVASIDADLIWRG